MAPQVKESVAAVLAVVDDLERIGEWQMANTLLHALTDPILAEVKSRLG